MRVHTRRGCHVGLPQDFWRSESVTIFPFSAHRRLALGVLVHVNKVRWLTRHSALSMDSLGEYPSAGSARARRGCERVPEESIAGPPRPYHRRPWCWLRSGAHTRCPSPVQDGKLLELRWCATSARPTSTTPFADDRRWRSRPRRATPPCLEEPEQSQLRLHAETSAAASRQQCAIETSVATIGRDAAVETRAAASGWRQARQESASGCLQASHLESCAGMTRRRRAATSLACGKTALRGLCVGCWVAGLPAMRRGELGRSTFAQSGWGMESGQTVAKLRGKVGFFYSSWRRAALGQKLTQPAHCCGLYRVLHVDGFMTLASHTQNHSAREAQMPNSLPHRNDCGKASHLIDGRVFRRRISPDSKSKFD